MGKKRSYLTERDIDILIWIGEQYAVTVSQLQILMGRDAQKETKEKDKVTLGTAERKVKNWGNLGMVERKKLFYNKPAWIWLTKNGLTLLPRDYRYLEPKLSRLNELEWINYVRLFIERRRNIEWRSERQLRYEWGRDESKKDVHVPDAEIVTDQGVVALEVELTQKSDKRISLILRSLVRDYDTIWYFTNQAVEGYINRQIEKLGQEQRERFLVYRLEDTRI